MRTEWKLTVLAALLLAAGALHAGELATLKMTLQDGTELTAKQQDETTWTATDGKTTYTLAGTDEMAFRKGDAAIAEGKLKGDKLKMQTPDGKLYLVLKFSIEKIKISLTDDGEPWEIKVKLNKAKLRKDGNELFSAKHYPDTGKLKVKTAEGVTVLESHDFKKVSAAPLGLYVPDYDEAHRKLVLLALLARQR